MSTGNVVLFRPRLAPKLLSDLECRTRERFQSALSSVVNAAFEDAKNSGLGDLEVERIVGLIGRALDATRLQYGW